MRHHPNKSALAEPRELKTLLVLFFFSGFPALIYQLIWERALLRILGVNIESVTITVTAFMLGLGLGSLAGGLASRNRSLSPLLILAVIEFSTGIFGHFSLGIFQNVGTLVLGQPLAVTACATLALVFIPTLLMGATLPLLVAYAVRVSSSVGNSVGRLYYVNTLGAGAVCLIAGVLLFPFLQSMQSSVDVAVAMNATIALCALAALYREKKNRVPALETPTEKADAVPPVLGLWQMLALAFFGGFVSLSYEIFFFRTISYASASSAADFTYTLGAFLVGLASGARLTAEDCRDNAAAVARKALTSLLAASVLGFAFLPLLSLVGPLRLGNRNFGTAAALLLIYLIARGWGRLLPSLAHLGISTDKRAGLKTAWLYLSNIFGSAAGSILTGFVLMDGLGLIDIARALVLAGLLFAAAFAFALPIPRRERLRTLSTAMVFCFLAIAFLPALSANVLENLLSVEPKDRHFPFVQVVENRSGILTVDQDSVVFGNGIYDGIFNTSLLDDRNGVVRPYALSYYNAAPKKVLEIGLSSGSWAQIIANNPDVESLTIVEINPGYLKMIANRSEVSSLLTNPKINIVIDDGRRWLRLHPEQKFDAIISNTTFHFRANSTNLLSAEFFDLIKQHLNPGGTMFFNTTDSARTQRTGCAMFPHGMRFLNHLIVSMDPLPLDVERWKKSLSAERIDDRPVFDLSRARDREFFDRLDGISDAANLGHGRPMESCADILARTADLDLITDDNMGTEWRHQFGLE
jgi:predicted membrane-bound spermidine synthase